MNLSSSDLAALRRRQASPRRTSARARGAPPRRERDIQTVQGIDTDRTDGGGMRVSFFIPGQARSTQTGTVVWIGHRSVPLRRGSAWSTYCGLVAMRYRPPMPFAGPVAVELVILFPSPKSGATRIPGRLDVENTATGPLNAFQGVLYVNDRQICDLVLRKRFAREPGIRVEVQMMPETWSPEYRQ